MRVHSNVMETKMVYIDLTDFIDYSFPILILKSFPHYP